MVIYQFSNAEQMFFVVFFSVLVVISVVVGIACSPMFKMILLPEITIKPKVLLSFICLPIYILCISGLIFGVFNIARYGSAIQNTNLDNCVITSGEISDIVAKPQLSRGADLVSYHVEFAVDSRTFFIDKDIGVLAEDMEYWEIGEYITIYYYTEGDKNMVIRVEK